MAWSDGLVPTAAGWTASRAVFAAPSCAADRIARAGVTLAAATDAPGLLFDCSLVEAYGAGVVLNGQSGALELYAVDATGAATSRHLLHCRQGTAQRWTLRDRGDQAPPVLVDERHARERRRAGRLCLVYNNTSAPANSARMMGAPGVVSLNGSPRIDWYEHTVPVAASPHLVMLGDSNYETSSIALTSTDWRLGWPYMLDDARARGDVLIAARGGDETIHTLPRLAADCTSWRALCDHRPRDQRQRAADLAAQHGHHDRGLRGGRHRAGARHLSAPWCRPGSHQRLQRGGPERRARPPPGDRHRRCGHCGR
jgi:hypothetical protein